MRLITSCRSNGNRVRMCAIGAGGPVCPVVTTACTGVLVGPTCNDTANSVAVIAIR